MKQQGVSDTKRIQMFHKSKGPGQPQQWLRVCASCEYIYVGEHRGCPKCEFAHYGAFWVYDGWLRALWYFITQIPYRRSNRE